MAKILADIDLGKRILMDLGRPHLPAIALGHQRDLLLLTIGSSDRPVLGDLKITLTLYARGRRPRKGPPPNSMATARPVAPLLK